MTTYKIEFDFINNRFNDTYPIFLQPTGITQLEFQSMVSFISAKFAALHLRRLNNVRMSIIFAFLSLFLGMAALGGSLALVLTTRIQPLWTLFAIACLFTMIVPLTISIVQSKRNLADNQNTYAEIQNDMININQQFNPRGAQFIFKVNQIIVGGGKHRGYQDIPVIEMLIVNTGNVVTQQPYRTMDPFQQSTPVYYQNDHQQQNYQGNVQYQGQVYQSTPQTSKFY